jgi:hypothetical protein
VRQKKNRRYVIIELTREVVLSEDLILGPGPRKSAACTLGCLGVRRFVVEGESKSAT